MTSVLLRLNMMTSSNGNIFRITGPLCGEFTGPSEFPTQRTVTRSFDVFFYLRLNKWLSKQPWSWWFETPSWSLWRQCNEKTSFKEDCTFYMVNISSGDNLVTQLARSWCSRHDINSLQPSDGICWITINEILWHSLQGNVYLYTWDINPQAFLNLHI